MIPTAAITIYFSLDLVSHPLIGIMWRVLRSQRRLQHVLARASSQAQVAQAIGVRSFSRKVPGASGTPDPMPEKEMHPDAQKPSLFSATDFYDELAEEEVDEEDEHDDEEYRRKQEEIQKELDSRTGLVWTDPWEVSEEQWMSSTTVEDLPDWSPEYVSRISQERVKIHPGRCNNLVAESAEECLFSRLYDAASHYSHTRLSNQMVFLRYRQLQSCRFLHQLARILDTDKPKPMLPTGNELNTNTFPSRCLSWPATR
jgi:hypothetical protein